MLWLMVLPWSFVQTLRWWTIGASAHTFRFQSTHPMIYICRLFSPCKGRVLSCKRAILTVDQSLWLRLKTLPVISAL